MDSIVLSFIVASIVVVAVYFYLSRTSSSPSSSVSIQGTIADGKKQVTSKLAVPRSFNQKEGATFSYTCWIMVNDFAYKYGSQKVIFTKGPDDLSSMCPALFLDGTTNTLIMKMDTFGGNEVIPISNIPAKKWIHVAIVVDQDSVDVYINGVLHTHHSLSQLPKQNNGMVHIGLNGGFDGKISGLQYYSYFMTPAQVSASMSSAPQTSDPLPQYFDAKWYTPNE